ncbi:MAG: trypsin-like peptidase domain-containing protein [Saprospiraceae bacterium]|nr:trypsin-like peptidase domain-containing protein [Saprospiraceae bacterium]
MKLLIFYVLLILFSLNGNAQSISEIKSAVSFIYIKDSQNKLIAIGTCFFVGLESSHDNTKFHSYLVTAKHVLQSKDGSFYKEVYIRMNTIDSNSKYTLLPIETGSMNKNLFLHNDPTVDIAVIPYIPPKKNYQFKFLDSTFLRDRIGFKNLNLEEGTETFFTGLFTYYTGDKKILPIVRYGRIALITNEKIEWVGMKREMLLLETSSYGGNSGSPVYFKINLPKGLHKLILGGILNGTYRDAAEIKTIENSAILTPYAFYNNGISGITPVYLLTEILYSAELRKHRE